MFVLAIDLSTESASVALLDNTEVLGNHSWTVTRGNPGRLLSALSKLLTACDVDIAEIESFAVGLGPGAFTGLRISLAAFMALALPGKKAVYGLSSAEAIAAIVAGSGAEPATVTVIGDARRDRLWTGEFSADCGGIRQTGSFALIPAAEFREKVTPGSIVATPDWSRLEQKLGEVAPASVHLIEEPVVPTATAIGKLAATRSEAALPSEPLQPIYMHPPVFERRVRPRL